MKKQRRHRAKMRALQIQRVVTVGGPWTAKHRHWKSEANEDHQLSPVDKATDERASKMNSFRSEAAARSTGVK